MEQLTKNQAVATSQEAVQNQNEPQLRDENAHNDKSVHGVLNPTYQAGLRPAAVQPDIEAERKKRDEIEAGKSYCSRRFGGATCDDKSAQIYARFFFQAEDGIRATSVTGVQTCALPIYPTRCRERTRRLHREERSCRSSRRRSPARRRTRRFRPCTRPTPLETPRSIRAKCSGAHRPSDFAPGRRSHRCRRR